MALPATHIRFAAAIADRLAVSDRQAYFSGTLYPDSRWLTGIDRRLTHDSHFLDPGFVVDDFTLGWHLHCVCDHLQERLHLDLLPDLAALTADASWVRRSAAKVLQDRHDAAEGNLGACLPLLTDCRTPNEETAETVATYFAHVRHAYRRQTTPDWVDYALLWSRVGLKKPLIAAIETEVGRLQADKAFMRGIAAVFDRMVARWKAIQERPLPTMTDDRTAARGGVDR